MAYHALTEQEAVAYVKGIAGLFSEGAAFTSHEIGDGNLNLVFHICEEATGKSVIVKQALPYARVVGESWPLTLDRSRIEYEALTIEDKLASGLVPKVYHYDAELALIVMEDLSDHVIMRKGLIEGKRYPLFSKHIGQFLAHTLFFTSDLGAHPYEKKANVGTFINPELCKITEDLIFTDPFEDAETNNFNPLIRPQVEAIWNDAPLKREVTKLKYDFLTKAQALLHGDLHTGSIFVTEESTKVIDPEFAYYGPIGFDVGQVFGNLLLNYAAQHGLQPNEAERASYREYLLDTLENVWHEFATAFTQLWQAQAVERSAHVTGFRDEYVASLLEDSVGYAGCEVLRRVIGLAGVADLNTIAADEVRAEAERIALELGKALILHRKSVKAAADITALVKQVIAGKIEEVV